jgi:CheY-like chemotaxis protein
LATIFIVDDNPMISRPLGLLMNLIGHQTTCFTDPGDLLPALRARRPAVVLLDLSMPGVDGFSVLRSVRNDPDRALAATPILIWSAVCDHDCVARAAAAGANDYLIKGIPFDDLQKRLVPFVGEAAPAARRSRTKQIPLDARTMLREPPDDLPPVAVALGDGALPSRRPRAKPAAAPRRAYI